MAVHHFMDLTFIENILVRKDKEQIWTYFKLGVGLGIGYFKFPLVLLLCTSTTSTSTTSTSTSSSINSKTTLIVARSVLNHETVMYNYSWYSKPLGGAILPGFRFFTGDYIQLAGHTSSCMRAMHCWEKVTIPEAEPEVSMLTTCISNSCIFQI